MRLSSVRTRLVTASALMLFTELLLIRWLGANLLHLSYFSNIVLLGSFLGIGLGEATYLLTFTARGFEAEGGRSVTSEAFRSLPVTW